MRMNPNPNFLAISVGGRYGFAPTSTLACATLAAVSRSVYIVTAMSSDKHFLDSASGLVIDSLQGLCSANPEVKLDVNHKGKSWYRP